MGAFVEANFDAGIHWGSSSWGVIQSLLSTIGHLLWESATGKKPAAIAC
jgi:hypothetical protein